MIKDYSLSPESIKNLITNCFEIIKKNNFQIELEFEYSSYGKEYRMFQIDNCGLSPYGKLVSEVLYLGHYKNIYDINIRLGQCLIGTQTPQISAYVANLSKNKKKKISKAIYRLSVKQTPERVTRALTLLGVVVCFDTLRGYFKKRKVLKVTHGAMELEKRRLKKTISKIEDKIRSNKEKVKRLEEGRAQLLQEYEVVKKKCSSI